MRAILKGWLGGDIERRVEILRERGYREVGRSGEIGDFKTFNNRGCYKSTDTIDRVIVVMEKE